MMSGLARRFAEALAGMTVHEDAEEFIRQLDSVSSILRENGALLSFLADKSIPGKCRKETIGLIFGGQVHRWIINTLCLLTDMGRIDLAGGIAAEYMRITDARRNILDIIITSAKPLEKQDADRIGNKFVEIYGAKSFRAELVVDSGLIGGITVQIGENVIDASVRTRLDLLRESLAIRQ
jgi:F-type H+-transporting ATPase subunit delta